MSTPFPQQPVKTVLAVAKGLVAPNYVVHDRAGGWLALPDPPVKPPKDLRTVAWMDVLVVDPDLAQLCQLAPGEVAERDDMHAPWSVRTLPSPKTRAREQAKQAKTTADHQQVRERERKFVIHRDALVAYAILLGLAEIVIAVFAYMLAGGIPQVETRPWHLWTELQAAWWPLVASGATWIATAIAVAITRRGWWMLPGVVVALVCFGYPLYRDSQLLPGHLIFGGLAAVLLWRGVALEVARLRLRRVRERYDASHPARPLEARTVTAPRERTVSTVG